MAIPLDKSFKILGSISSIFFATLKPFTAIFDDYTIIVINIFIVIACTILV